MCEDHVDCPEQNRNKQENQALERGGPLCHKAEVATSTTRRQIHFTSNDTTEVHCQKIGAVYNILIGPFWPAKQRYQDLPLSNFWAHGKHHTSRT